MTRLVAQDTVINLLKQFANQEEYTDTFRPGSGISSQGQLDSLYKESAGYLLYTTTYHKGYDVQHFLEKVAPLPSETVVDIGCASGIVGLSFAMTIGCQVTFLDYEGVGLDFIRWAATRLGLTDNVTVIPFGSEGEQRFDLCLACDVLEHSGNQLRFIEWCNRLANRVALCYPLSGIFTPTYQSVLEDWVDDQAIEMVLTHRYNVCQSYLANGRRFFEWAKTE